MSRKSQKICSRRSRYRHKSKEELLEIIGACVEILKEKEAQKE